MTNFKINVVSDVICPFCYLGKKRLERSIETWRKVVPGGDQDTFTVNWYPFYLDPTLPAVGVPSQERLAVKFGPDRVQAIQARLRAMGEGEGIHFSFGGKVGNTRDAHRLVQLAKASGVQDGVVTSLFRGYFEEGGDVTDREMLLAAGERGGLNRAEAEAWLASGKGGDQVDREVQEAYAKGVTGVPSFTINGRYHVEGAEDVQAFLAEFARVKEAAK